MDILSFYSALESSGDVLRRMSKLDALAPFKKNQFGDTCLNADWQCEEAVIEHLRSVKIPIRIISEEHGEIDLVENPELLGVLDGIDGTDAAREDFYNGRFTTMLGVFNGLNPSYNKSLYSGILEHNTGVFVDSILGVFPRGKLNRLNEAQIYVDGFRPNVELFRRVSDNFETSALASSGSHYLDFILGKVDVVLECTRKKNLEIAVAYPLVRKAGGIMVDGEGEDIGNKIYLKFGQGKDEHLPIITAPTLELAKEVIGYLRR